MLRSLILLAAMIFVLPLITNGQEGMPVSVRPCGTDRLLEQLRKDPSYLKRERTINEVILQKHNMNVFGAPPAIITLPVVVHIINENPTAYTDAAVDRRYRISMTLIALRAHLPVGALIRGSVFVWPKPLLMAAALLA